MTEEQPERRRGDRLLRELLDGEYSRNVITLAKFRLAGTGLWLALVVILPILSPLALGAAAAARPWVALHVLYSVVLLVGLSRKSPTVTMFHRATQACPDITFLFFSQFALISASGYPQNAAIFSLALFLAFLIPNPAGARRAPLYTAAVLSVFYVSGLLWAAGVRDWVWPSIAAFLLGYAAFFGDHLGGRSRQLVLAYARDRTAPSDSAAD